MTTDAHRSGLFVGHVRHRRLRPVDRAFRYRVYYLLLDIDEIERLDDDLRFFSWRRRNLISMRPEDHGPRDGTSLRVWATTQLARAGVAPGDVADIQLLAFPRVLGYVFNPLSIWYCRNTEGTLIAVIHEVRNTFGDVHAYVVPLAGDGTQAGDRSHRFAKAMHVSPLMPMDQEYRFSLNDPGETLSVSIRQYDAEGEIFRAGLSARRVALDDRSLLEVFLTHPLVTLKAIGAIHWQAMLTWIAGARFHRRPSPPVDPVTVVGKAPAELAR